MKWQHLYIDYPENPNMQTEIDYSLLTPEEIKNHRKEKKIEIIPPTPIELFIHDLLNSVHTDKDYAKIGSGWKTIKKNICTKLKIPLQKDKEVFIELEKQKRSNDFSFEKIIFVSEAIKKS